MQPERVEVEDAALGRSSDVAGRKRKIISSILGASGDSLMILCIRLLKGEVK
jgi:hypothetical protein